MLETLELWQRRSVQIDETRGPSQTGLIITVRHLFLSPCRVSDDVRDSQEVAAKKQKKRKKKVWKRRRSRHCKGQREHYFNETMQNPWFSFISPIVCRIIIFYLFFEKGDYKSVRYGKQMRGHNCQIRVHFRRRNSIQLLISSGLMQFSKDGEARK